MDRPDVHDFVENYRFEFDGGGSYAPKDHEKAMLEDAICAFLSLITDEKLEGERVRREAIMSA